MDNILIFSKIETKYIEYIRKVLEKLKKANILFKLEKCEFYKKELEFLIFIIRRNNIYIDPRKVEIVIK